MVISVLCSNFVYNVYMGLWRKAGGLHFEIPAIIEALQDVHLFFLPVLTHVFELPLLVLGECQQLEMMHIHLDGDWGWQNEMTLCLLVFSDIGMRQIFEEMKNIKQKIKHSPYGLRKVLENHFKIQSKNSYVWNLSKRSSTWPEVGWIPIYICT